ncbi:two-component system response regulator [Psychroflexus torquis ATCC 700755]|uniref:Two-component system response regulator n=1 Tax=Psychroflexus torquis (strain ATCC 700755 / CIP 106069 / ACAM 623) TaxID=313595 RepID=K4IEV4_PSYTT|nr:response regulator [Psychroflexus torquis]AFU68383.1 two-component system response regulator [Psychroflexus torquis ATCC 700755]
MTETNILLVDDNDIGNFLSKKVLTRMGFNNITTVTDGKQALDRLKKEDCPDLVFLDLNMPVMDGFSFLTRAEKEILCMHMKVVILTSSIRQKDKNQASKFSSVVDYIEKPLNQDKVRQVLEKIKRINTDNKELR